MICQALPTLTPREHLFSIQSTAILKCFGNRIYLCFTITEGSKEILLIWIYLSTVTTTEVGREVGGGVQDGEHMYTHGWFMSMYGKSHYNIVK